MENYTKPLSHHQEYGLRIRVILDPDSSRIGEFVDGMVITGDMSHFKEEIREKEIDVYPDFVVDADYEGQTYLLVRKNCDKVRHLVEQEAEIKISNEG